VYIEIDKTAIPYRFDIELAGEIFNLEIRYNSRFDFFTVDLEREGEIVVQGEKIMYGRPLFSYLNDNRLPAVDIIPLNESGDPVDRVGWDNLGDTVFLMVGERI
jgi:hypothetical protein